MRLPDGAVAYGAVSKADVGDIIEGVCNGAIRGGDAEAAASYSFEFIVGKLDRFDTGVHRASPVFRSKLRHPAGAMCAASANMAHSQRLAR